MEPNELKLLFREFLTVRVPLRRLHIFPKRQLLGHLPYFLQCVRVILHSVERIIHIINLYAHSKVSKNNGHMFSDMSKGMSITIIT